MKRRSERVADGERDEMVLAKDIKSWGSQIVCVRWRGGPNNILHLDP